ncbi:MAG: ubiquitin-activating E1 FCCH domain-containing protein [Patescibacteria group bacterium]
MTAPYQPFLVANQRVATDLSMAPWLIPPDAYTQILDAYLFRGDLIKRDGYSWFDAMPHAVQGSAGNEYQNIANITTTTNAQVTTHGNHGLTNGQLIRLTDVDGILPGADGVQINGARWTVSNAAGSTFNINNVDAFTGSYTANTGTLSIFPGIAIMAIAPYLNSSTTPVTTDLLILDERRAAIYDTTQNCFKPIGYTDQFTGGPTNLFWWENYRNALFFTNNIDNIFYWNGTQLAVGLTRFTPVIDNLSNNHIVNTCLMIKSVNNRLCLYNTNETPDSTPINFPTRIRWCEAGVDPIAGGSPPTSPDLGNGTWYDNVPGSGGNNFDLTDSLYIISQAQIQTNNLVISQNSQFAVIYEQRPTSDIQQPYTFVKIATSRNVNSTFGTIILDREVQLVGNSGLVMTDGNSVGRYDDKLPDFSVDVISQNDFQNAFGIRNDTLWQSWTLFTSVASLSGLNDSILVYNYQDKSFQFYRIPLSCAGIFPNPAPSPTWLSYGPDFEFRDFGDETWISTQTQAKPLLLGGGYDGNIWNMSTGVGGDASGNVAYGDIVPPGFVEDGNSITMEVTTRQWFPYAKEGLASQFGYIDFLIDGDPTTVVGVEFNVDNETSNYLTTFFTCIPYENLDFSTIQNIIQPSNPCQIESIDHGLITGQTVYIFAVQGMTELNGLSATVTVLDSANFTLDGVNNASFGAYTGDGIVSQQPITQNTFWTRVNVGQTGVFHQMKITAQGTDENFTLHASLPWFKPSGRIYKG